MKRVYVWTLPTRLFHWLFVALIIGSWAATFEERWLSIHAALGSSAGVLVVFRIGWGIMGPKYSRFGDFTLGFGPLKAYLAGLLNPSRRYIGHNPAAGFVMLAMLAGAALAVLSGMLLYGIQENRGVLAFLHLYGYRDMELFEEMHEFFVNLVWILAAVHAAGVMTDRILHSQDKTLTSMIDGYKNMEGENAVVSPAQKGVAIAGIGGTAALLIYAFAIPDNTVVAGYTPKSDYGRSNPVFANECGSCHTLYPPSLLPKESWRKLMGDLSNHFGDDASLDPADHQTILSYLLSHSAEDSTQEMSVKMVQSLQNRDIIAITQTPFWKKTHDDIPAGVFLSDPVKSRANCKACHADVEQGLIEDGAIKAIPRKAER